MRMLKRSFYLLSFSSFAFSAESLSYNNSYTETGHAGEPASWMTNEFRMQRGLEAINAHYAYARGYNGVGVNIGIMDTKLFPHPEFTGKLVQLDENSYPLIKVDPVTKEVSYKYHGVHVAGIAAANRDGSVMHGVAYGASLTSGSLPHEKNYFEKMIQSNVRVINNSWSEDIAEIEKDDKDEYLFFPNGTLRYTKVSPDDMKSILIPYKDNIDSRSKSQIPENVSKDDANLNNLAGMLRAARHNKLIVFSAGNENNYNVPTLSATLPHIIPDVLDRYLTVTNLTPNNELSLDSTICGHTASYCVSAPGTDIYSAAGVFVSENGRPITTNTELEKFPDISPGYVASSGTSMSAPHVTGAAAVLMQRFPYMTAAQISTVLKSTSADLGEPGIDARFGWGKINLKDAIDGPKMFISPLDIPSELYVPGSYTDTQFIADIPGINATVNAGTPLEYKCISTECDWDVWRNNIAGHGGLTKKGVGTLVLTGENTYSGPTFIEQGMLVVNGSVISDVSVEKVGVISGSGKLGSLAVRKGGTLAPGNSIGVMSVKQNISFEPGSRFVVEVGYEKNSDQVNTSGSADIAGGEVIVKLENNANLLDKYEVRSLLGTKYRILSAQLGVRGRFDSVSPNYLFIGTGLDYQNDYVSLRIGRNEHSFASVALTENEASVGSAVDTLPQGNSVYESLLLSDNKNEARKALNSLSGQIHSDISSSLINESRYLREALNERLRNAEGITSSSTIKSTEEGAWAKMLGAWAHGSGNPNATGYQSSTYGVLMGVDSKSQEQWRLGVATGFSRTLLHGGLGSNAKSNNLHLAAYGNKQLGALALRSGIGYTWHRIDTTRTVIYGNQSDIDAAKYNARTNQLFAEAGYLIKGNYLNTEPFANLTYLNFKSDGITEEGGATALNSGKQHTDATLSTLGIRADRKMKIGKDLTLRLNSEIGWQHLYGDSKRDTGLKFVNSDTTFNVSSVSASKDSLALKVGAELMIKNNITLNLGYNGLLSQNNQDNSVNAGLTWNF